MYEKTLRKYTCMHRLVAGGCRGNSQGGDAARETKSRHGDQRRRAWSGEIMSAGYCWTQSAISSNSTTRAVTRADQQCAVCGARPASKPETGSGTPRTDRGEENEQMELLLPGEPPRSAALLAARALALVDADQLDGREHGQHEVHRRQRVERVATP